MNKLNNWFLANVEFCDKHLFNDGKEHGYENIFSCGGYLNGSGNGFGFNSTNYDNGLGFGHGCNSNGRGDNNGGGAGMGCTTGCGDIDGSIL